MLFFFVRDSFRPAYGSWMFCSAFFLKPLILPQLLLPHWSHKGQYAIVCNWNSLLSYQLTLIAEIHSLKSESIERPATGENKLCPILHLLCMELLEKKTDMPLTLIYGTLHVCTFVMCLVKTSTVHLRHLLKVDFDVCFLTFLFVVLSLFLFATCRS